MEKTLSIKTGAVERANSVLRQVYTWMTAGLGLTAVIALGVLGNQRVMTALLTSPGLLIMLFIGEIAMVIYLTARIQKISLQSARNLFLAYSAVNGVTLAPLLFIYTSASIVSTLFVTAGTFGVLSIWAMTTKRDLTGWGKYLVAGLVGLIIASIVNFFLRSSQLEWLISIAGVVLFMGLTAYDTRIIKSWSDQLSADDAANDQVRKLAIVGALKLYLDFINLFIFLLRILGRRR